MENIGAQLHEKDSVTGLYRREIIFSKLDEILLHAQQIEPTVILVEIHRFKQINDGIGPQIGDRIIKGFAKRLTRTASDEAIVGRMGGDGFAIIIPSKEQVAETISNIQEILRRPFSVGGNVVVVSGTLGVATGPRDGRNAHDLIRAADIALHSVNSSSCDVSYFEVAMLEEAQSLHLLENDLRYSIVLEKPDLLKAVSSKQFEVFYQPQISSSLLKPIGVEALMRWHHPDRGYVSPEEFIPLAEEIGVIDLLGAWILKKACSDIAKIRQNNQFKDLTVSVNVSPRQLDDISAFIGHVKRALSESNLPATTLKLEITENTVFSSKESEILQLSDCGCSLSLDDYGTGYSSMNVLRGFPFENVKMDKIFVSDLFLGSETETDRDEKMICAFQAMCKALGLKTTIEGVETEKQVKFLRGLGCDVLQGYYFSRPIPYNELLLYLEKIEEVDLNV